MFLAPLTARSKVREVLRGLVATRQVHTISLGHAPHFYVAGTLPEFAVLPHVYASSSMPASAYFLHSHEHEEDTPERATLPAAGALLATPAALAAPVEVCPEVHTPRMPAAHKPCNGSKPSARGRTSAVRPPIPATANRRRGPRAAARPAVQAQRPEVRLRGQRRALSERFSSGARRALELQMEPSPPMASATGTLGLELDQRLPQQWKRKRPQPRAKVCSWSSQRQALDAGNGQRNGNAASATAPSRLASLAPRCAAPALCAQRTAPQEKMRGPMRARHAAAASPLWRPAPRPETKSGMALLPRRKRAPGGAQRSADDR